MRFFIFLLCLFPFSTALAMKSKLGNVDSKYIYVPAEQHHLVCITIELLPLQPGDNHQNLVFTTRSRSNTSERSSSTGQLPDSFIILFQTASHSLPDLNSIPVSQQMMSLLMLLFYAESTNTPLAPMSASMDGDHTLTLVLGSNDAQSLTVKNSIHSGSGLNERYIEITHKFGRTQMWHRKHNVSSIENARPPKKKCKPDTGQPTHNHEDDDDEDDRGCFSKWCCPRYSWSIWGDFDSEQERLITHKSTTYGIQACDSLQILNLRFESEQGMSGYLWKVTPQVYTNSIF